MTIKVGTGAKIPLKCQWQLNKAHRSLPSLKSLGCIPYESHESHQDRYNMTLSESSIAFLKAEVESDELITQRSNADLYVEETKCVSFTPSYSAQRSCQHCMIPAT
jgi:hypothetical protein